MSMLILSAYLGFLGVNSCAFVSVNCIHNIDISYSYIFRPYPSENFIFAILEQENLRYIYWDYIFITNYIFIPIWKACTQTHVTILRENIILVVIFLIAVFSTTVLLSVYSAWVWVNLFYFSIISDIESIYFSLYSKHFFQIF